MKPLYVADLKDGQIVVSLFLVREKEIRTSARTGTSWLHLDLADRTGTISGKMWDNFAALVDTFARDDVIHIRGRVKLFNGQKELALEQITPAAHYSDSHSSPSAPDCKCTRLSNSHSVCLGS
jgi:3'-5' exoribonuclease